MSWGCASAAGLGQGLANWWCSLCSLQAALGVSLKFRASLLSLSGTKICPACDSFQRPLAASPDSWLFLKRQAAAAKAIWKQKWCSGALMLQERVSARGCPRCGWGWLRASSSPLKEEAGRLTGMQYPSLLPFVPCVRASFCPQEHFGETWCNQTQPPHLGSNLLRVRASPPDSLAPQMGLMQLTKATVTQLNDSQAVAQTGKDQK